MPYLPDRNFIIKSKTLSGPALLKTKTFGGIPHSDKNYLEIVEEKFKENGLTHARITGNLMELRKDVFEKKNKVFLEKSSETGNKNILQLEKTLSKG